MYVFDFVSHKWSCLFIKCTCHVARQPSPAGAKFVVARLLLSCLLFAIRGENVSALSLSTQSIGADVIFVSL